MSYELIRQNMSSGTKLLFRGTRKQCLIMLAQEMKNPIFRKAVRFRKRNKFYQVTGAQTHRYTIENVLKA